MRGGQRASRSPRAVVFDLDGTLCDTLSDIAAAVNGVLDRMGFPAHAAEQYRYFVGEGIGMLARHVLPDDRRDQPTVTSFAKAISREYAARLLEKTRPYDGIVDLLGELVKRKIGLAVASNKPHDLALRTVSACFPDIAFGVVLGERTGMPPKPDPAIALKAASGLSVPPSRCLYVGDSGIDMQTATAAGMFAVGVLWGFRKKEELVAHGAKALIEHPLQLLEVLDKKFESMAGILGTGGNMLKSLSEDKKKEREL